MSLHTLPVFTCVCLSVSPSFPSGVQQMCLSPAQVDPFYSQGESLSSDDYLDQTWITVFGYLYC